MATTKPDSTWTVLLPGFIVAGIGIGTVNPVLASSAISVVPPERSGMASGANSTFRQVGIATGIAGLGSVFQSQIQAHTLGALRGDRHRQGGPGPWRSRPSRAPSWVGRSTRQRPPSRRTPSGTPCSTPTGSASRPSLNSLMVIGAVIALIGSIGAFALVRQRDFVPSVTPAGPPVEAPVEVAA